MKNVPLLKTILALLIVASASYRSLAQSQDEQLFKQILNEIDEKYSKRVEQALKKDMGKFNKMKSDLEEVDKVKDNNGKKKGLDNYRGAHRDNFNRAVQEAGVNLNQLLAGLQQKYPGYTFSIVDDFGILVEKKSANAEATGNAFNESAETENIDILALAKAHGPSVNHSATFFQDLAFSQTKNVNCAVAGGGNVDFGFRMIRAYSTGVVAGGCSSDGRLNNSTVIPAQAQSVKLNITGSFECSGYALGIIGTSYAAASTGLTANVAEARAWPLNGPGESGQIFAPVLWYASFNKSRTFSHSVDLTPWKGMALNISGYTRTSAGAIFCCGTTANSRLSITGANLSVVR